MKSKKEEYREVYALNYDIVIRFRLPVSSLSKMTVVDYDRIVKETCDLAKDTRVEKKLNDVVLSTMKEIVPDMVEVYSN